MAGGTHIQEGAICLSGEVKRRTDETHASGQALPAGGALHPYCISAAAIRRQRAVIILQNEEKKSIFNGEKLLIQAENEAVIRKCFTLLKKTFNINTSVNEKRVGKSGKAGAGTGAKPRAYEIELTDPSQIKAGSPGH